MNKLLDKIKAMDKKVLVGISVGVIVVIVAIILLAVTSGGKKPVHTDYENTESVTESSSETIEENIDEEEDGTESLFDTEVTEATESTEIGTEVGTEVTGVGEGVSAGDALATNPNATDIPDSTTEGNASSPYLVFPEDDMTVTTVSIGGGKSVYYSIYRIGNMNLTIHDTDAYIVYNGTKYTASNGTVSIRIGDVLASDAVTLEIGNAGSTAKAFTLQFSNPTGSYNNPTIVTSFLNSETFTVSLSAGDNIGHYYKYVAEQTGTMIFYVSSCTAGVDPGLSVTNNRSMANRTLQADVQYDANGMAYIAMDVTAGDELSILLYTNPDAMWNYPAADIVWGGRY